MDNHFKEPTGKIYNVKIYLALDKYVSPSFKDQERARWRPRVGPMMDFGSGNTRWYIDIFGIAENLNRTSPCLS